MFHNYAVMVAIPKFYKESFTKSVLNRIKGLQIKKKIKSPQPKKPT